MTETTSRNLLIEERTMNLFCLPVSRFLTRVAAYLLPMARVFAHMTLMASIPFAVAGPALANPKPIVPVTLQSAGILAWGPGNVLFVGDIKAASVHAFVLRDRDFASQQDVSMGNAHNFEGRNLIRDVDVKLAALLGTKPDQVLINDMIVRQPFGQIFLSVSRGRGPDARPAIVKVNHGKLELVDLRGLPHSEVHIANEPSKERLEFGQPERELAITDIKYYNGEIFVTGITNEEFSSALRRIHYPFDNRIATSTVEIWHSVHGEFETRAPIIREFIHEVNGQPYLFAVYACTPLVRIPLSALTDGAHVRGDTIGELGYGSTPIDMLPYTDASNGKEYLIVTNNMRGATRIAMADLDGAKPMPVNVSPNFGPDGISQYAMPITGTQHLALASPQWAVVIRRYPESDLHLDLHTLPLPFYLDRADQMVNMNWPGAPDPFGYHTAKATP